MAVSPGSTARRVNFTLLTVGLGIMSLLLAALIWILADAAVQTDDATTRTLLARLSWVAAATLGLTLLMLGWLIIRWLRMRCWRPVDTPPTEHPDAWKEAGRRIQPPPDDPS